MNSDSYPKLVDSIKKPKEINDSYRKIRYSIIDAAHNELSKLDLVPITSWGNAVYFYLKGISQVDSRYEKT